MSEDQHPEERRERPAATVERRNYTPGGRLRRIAFDHRSSVWVALGTIVLLLLLFAGTTALALNARFERDVAEIAYSRDSDALQFLLQKESEEIRQLGDTVAALESRVGALSMENGPNLVVSLEEKRVWYLEGEDTIFTAPVAVGSGRTIVMGGRTQRFQTPRGHMTITAKELDPVWVPPAWHYHKIAQAQGLRVVDMSNAAPDALAGYPAGDEPISDGVIYIPPYGSPQRRYTGVLGAAKLELRDGYYFHGTNNEASIGTAASAGCIRMLRDDILWMYENVPVGTDVYIY